MMSRGQEMAPISLEARTIRKLKVRIIPFIMLLYIISFLDRINISFAKFAMDQDLAINSHQFGLAFGIFFIGYSLFEIPSNLILHKIGARIWLARILIIWGIVSALTGLVQNVHTTLPGAFLTWVGGSGLFPRNYLILDLLVSAARTGSGARAVANRHTYYKHPGGSAFRPYPRPRTLAGAQQLALALYSGGTSGLGRRRADLLLAPQSSGGGQIPCRRRKGLDHSRAKTGRRRQAAELIRFRRQEHWSTAVSGTSHASVLPWAPRYS